MSFLDAQWRKLAIANYVVDPELLKPYLPYKTELDLWNGTCYVSLVGFMFLKTKMLGMAIPFHRDFEEVNLRFYVRHFDGKQWKRGVVFIKEIVPKSAITLVANTVYKEHYETMKMAHQWDVSGGVLKVGYAWWKGKQQNTFQVQADKTAVSIDHGTETEFITEHYWGYSKSSDQKTVEYEVTHPRWDAYPVQGYHIDVDFGAVYGDTFAFLSHEKPTSVMLAEGSQITVESKKVLG